MEDNVGALPGGGILGRFENVREKRSSKRVITCEAGTAEYIRNDYLKPNHLPIDRVDQEANYAPTSNLNETKFHKGFSRRAKADIQSDAARLEAEVMRERAREERARTSVAATMDYKDRVTFNLLTGEGVGREMEFRQIGKKIVNPFGCQEAVFAEHSRDATNRVRNSKHRFFEYPAVQNTQHRECSLFQEGLTETSRETAVLGYGRAGTRRLRSQSCGAPDNFAHLRALPHQPSFEAPNNVRTRSQIVLG